MPRRHILTPIVALVVFVALFGDALGQVSTHLLGLEYVDHYGTQWFYWFVEHQLTTDQSADHTDLFFYPWGKDIFAHTGTNVLDAYMALPFRLLFGHIAGYNLFVITMLVVSGVAAWFLAREATDDPFAADMAAILFAASPFVLFEAAEGRPTQAVLLFPVLFMLFTLRAGRLTGWKAPVLAGLFLAASGIQYWYYAFFGGMVCLAHGLWLTAWPRAGSGGRLRTLARHALIAGVALAGTLPFGYQLLARTASGDTDIPGLLDVDLWSLTANPPITREEITIGLQMWQPFRRYGGFFVQDHDGTERFLEFAVVMPILTVPLLAAVLLRPGKLPKGAFIAMAVTATLMACGPMIFFSDYALPNPPFIALIKEVGFLQRLWWPGRAAAFANVLLCLSIAAFLGSFAHARRLQLAGAAAMLLAWGADLVESSLLPVPSWNAAIPAGYYCLADGPEGALIELPYAWTQGHLYFQMAHGRPILGGMLENNETFTPDEFVTLREENEYLDALMEVSRLRVVDEGIDEAGKQELYDLGYRYVVLQRDAFQTRRSASGLLDNALRTRMRDMHKRLRRMLGEPVYDDARLTIYAPWGDPRPCAEDAVTPDEEAFGLTEVSIDSRIRRDPDQQVLIRIIEPPPEEDDGGEDGEDAEGAD